MSLMSSRTFYLYSVSIQYPTALVALSLSFNLYSKSPISSVFPVIDLRLEPLINNPQTSDFAARFIAVES